MKIGRVLLGAAIVAALFGSKRTKAKSGWEVTSEESDQLVSEAYQQGLETARFHVACAEALTQAANSTITLLAAAAFAALGYTVKLIENGSAIEVAVGVGGVAIYLLIITWLITKRCLKAGNLFPATNDPRNLIREGYSWAEIRKVDAKNLSVRIAFNADRNRKVGKALNDLRYAAFLSPGVFLMAWAVAAWVARQ